MPWLFKTRVRGGTLAAPPAPLNSLSVADDTLPPPPPPPPVKLAGYYRRSLRDQIPASVLPPSDSLAHPNAGTLVLVPNPVPICANPEIFPVSHFEICSYMEEAQRFLAATDLN